MEPMVAHPGPAGKDERRREVLAALARMPGDQRARQEQALVRVLDAESAAFEVVLATLPLGTEADLTPFLTSWLARGRKLALARTGPGRSLTFHYVSHLEGPWEPRPLGLREPPAGAPKWMPGPATLCLVPGVAFAPGPDGWRRLGRGAGYYDRWLELWGEAVTAWGTGFSLQKVAFVPVEGHDQRLEGMVLPEGLVRLSMGGEPDGEDGARVVEADQPAPDLPGQG